MDLNSATVFQHCADLQHQIHFPVLQAVFVPFTFNYQSIQIFRDGPGSIVKMETDVSGGGRMLYSPMREVHLSGGPALTIPSLSATFDGQVSGTGGGITAHGIHCVVRCGPWMQNVHVELQCNNGVYLNESGDGDPSKAPLVVSDNHPDLSRKITIHFQEPQKLLRFHILNNLKVSEQMVETGV